MNDDSDQLATDDQLEERYLLETIAVLQQAYQREAQRYFDRLAAIYARRPPPPVIIQMNPKDIPHWLRQKIDMTDSDEAAV